MTSNNQQVNKILKTIKIIHIALIVGPLILGGIALWLNMTSPIGKLEGLEIMMLIPGVLLIMAFVMSSIIFKQQINVNKLADKTLKEKLKAYLSAHIVRMSLFEVAGLMAGISSLITANNYNLGVLIIVAAIFYFMTPTASRIGIELQLTHEERLKLETN